ASLGVLAPYMSLSVAQMALATVPFDPTDAPSATARLQAMAGAGLSFGSAAPLAIFPANLLGTTFVFDPDSGRYVLDPNATGAPAAGIRMTLYAVDPVIGQILMPLNPVGYLDLIDVSTPATDAVRILAVIGTTPYLDYTASVTVTTSSATIAAEGFLSNGSQQVDFDLSLTATQSSIGLDYLLSSGGNSVQLVATVGAGENDLTATLTVRGGGDTVVMTVTVTPSTLSGQITYNGGVAVTISGTPDSPMFARPDGTPLTEAELGALVALGDIIEGLFDAFDNLLAPAFVVFVIT
ncbi:MAG: hypothetical protein OEY20_16585, partial [Gemmatimonadota bacterium]|nr:hypothetical protein [Gemmatimonadota bacterium]